MSAPQQELDDALAVSMERSMVLEDAIYPLIEEHDADPIAVIVACLCVIFQHVANEDGAEQVRAMFYKAQDEWRKERAEDAENGDNDFPPTAGVLQ